MYIHLQVGDPALNENPETFGMAEEAIEAVASEVEVMGPPKKLKKAVAGSMNGKKVEQSKMVFVCSEKFFHCPVVLYTYMSFLKCHVFSFYWKLRNSHNNEKK